MQSFNKTVLSNGVCLLNRHNPNTSRTSINIFINGGNRSELKPGLSDLTSRLLIKGTKNRSAEEIAQTSDANAIDLDIDVKQDYSRARATFLNDDINIAIDLLADILQNPTFELFDKEVKLLTGELQVELDSPRAKVNDLLGKGMYPDHPYGVVASIMLESIPDFVQQDTLIHHKNVFNANNTHIVVVGDYSQEQLIAKLEENFQHISLENTTTKELTIPEPSENKLFTISKEDVSQAQVMRGWYCPPVTSPDFPALSVLNNILGSAGLSSRLFIELRDKKGLAYSVRSSLEMLRFGGNLTIYIGTEPQNINIAIKGIEEEIEKLINEPISDEELESAQKNIIGKRAIYHETNTQQCYYLGLYHILGAGAEYDYKIPEMIKAVTKNDVQVVAQKYLTKKHVTSILAPSKFLSSTVKETI